MPNGEGVTLLYLFFYLFWVTLWPSISEVCKACHDGPVEFHSFGFTGASHFYKRGTKFQDNENILKMINPGIGKARHPGGGGT